MTELLSALCSLDGISGQEDSVREYIRNAAAPFADEIQQDAMGNLLVFKKGSTRGTHSLMLCAHMDEVGLMVRGVDPEGFVKFGAVGAIDKRVLPGKRVRCGKTLGVIGLGPVHLSGHGKDKSFPEIRNLSIDIGAQSDSEALREIALGDAFCFDTAPGLFGNGFYKAKAIDDRIGCAVMLSVLKNGVYQDTWFAFTVQEEIGARGAGTAAYAIAPDIALILEGTTAVDSPDRIGAERIAGAGEGPVLSYMDSSTYYDHGLFEHLCLLCKKHQIPWQLKRTVSGGTDASSICRTRGGVRVAGLAAPVRYIHSPASVCSLKDAENLLSLTDKFLHSLAIGELL
ncbi:MAG: M42 family peptidase [Oscillospiraceae bacterium]|nr:M42 family peptidase [Oscillospiraceae bacterium]